MVSDAPGWRDRVVDRSIARSTESLKARGLGPATRILEAAIALSTESSGASFSIQQVVDKADVALKTFYRHFGSKDALLLAMLEESIAESVGVIGESALQHADPVEQLRVIIIEPIMRAEEGKAGYELSVAREHFRLLELFPDEIERAVAPYVDLVESAIIRCPNRRPPALGRRTSRSGPDQQSRGVDVPSALPEGPEGHAGRGGGTVLGFLFPGIAAERRRGTL